MGTCFIRSLGVMVSSWFAFKDEKSLQELAGQCSMDLHHCLVPVFPWAGCSQYKLLMGGHVQQCVEGNTGDLAPELLTSNSCVNYPPPNESQLQPITINVIKGRELREGLSR